MPNIEDLTPGQQSWLEARAGTETRLVVFGATRTAVELVPYDEDVTHPWRARFTLVSADGESIQIDEWPPGAPEAVEPENVEEVVAPDLSAPSEAQQAYIDAALSSGATNSGALTGVLSDPELYDRDNVRNPYGVIWTITSEDGLIGKKREVVQRSEQEQSDLEAQWDAEEAAASAERVAAQNAELAARQQQAFDSNPRVVELQGQLDDQLTDMLNVYEILINAGLT